MIDEKLICKLIQERTKLPIKGIVNTVALLHDGATVPFISRYRKERTGSLDEVAIQSIRQELNFIHEISKRKETILASITEQNSLTPDLKQRISGCWDKKTLEDLYLPFKKKQKTKASVARAQGLEPLAKIIMAQRTSNLDRDAQRYVNNKVPSLNDALLGARHIIAEWINENSRARDIVRGSFERYAEISTSVVKSKKEDAHKYQNYFDFVQPLKKCPSHRILAMFRGEKEGLLRLSIDIDDTYSKSSIARLLIRSNNRDCSQQIEQAINDSLKRLLLPSIENEYRKSAKQSADEDAIQVFDKNLRDLLLAAPLGEKRILAIDPGFRTGCKVVALDQHGNYQSDDVIYPHPPQNRSSEAKGKIEELVSKYNIEAIAVGNGTAGKETYSMIMEADLPKNVETYFVNESGASIYSASELAREEFPDKDVTVRGAISIGRRLMDPLAELVKINPKSIGVGQYQHDVNQKLLKEKLANTVSSCVNNVGVNVNTASKEILSHVSGLGPVLAKNIVEYRKQNGAFLSRKDLSKVPRMGKKAYEQCAGFLRIKESTNILDNTAVHPESYTVVTKIIRDIGVKLDQLDNIRQQLDDIDLNRYVTDTIGLPTLNDIIKELKKPGLDPRGKAQPPKFSKLKSIEDLYSGMMLDGVVTNVTKFGAFVDIGIKENGLVHISQITNRYITDPSEILSVNQQVKVKVLDIDLQLKRISLTMKDL